MQKEMITQYSQALNQEMHVMVYGHGGVPFLCFPTQDSMCRNYEDFGMTDQLADFIIVDEALPLIATRNPGTPAVTGFSMGANHAVITFLRRPDLFRGVIALSGVYDTDYFFDGWMNPTLYESAPDRFLPGMRADHPYVALYNERKMILCVGQGAWEEDGVRSLKYLESVFRDKGIHAWCDFWGGDVNHDWPWWFKQMRYFIPKMIEE